MDIPTLGAAIIVLIGLYGLHRLALQRAYAQGLADGTHRGYAAGSGDAARRYGQGHEDGLIEGRAQAGRELTTPKRATTRATNAGNSICWQRLSRPSRRAALAQR